MNWPWLLFMCLVGVGVSALLIVLVLTNRRRGDDGSSSELVRRQAVGAIRRVRNDTARALVAVERDAHVRPVDVKAKEHQLLDLQIRALRREEAETKRRKRDEDWAIIRARREEIDRRLGR